MASQRTAKVNELIRREISQIIIKEIEIPENSLVTISHVETSLDLREAKIRVSIFPTDQAKIIFKNIYKRIGYLQGLLNRRLNMRPLPRIRFVLDSTEAQASQVEDILNKIES